ncbi:cyclase family protein [Rhodococcus wratislaviensis]|uniref:Cyclase n=1 Tax=Rhodococcus wratislaviensis NBRC 100605 TaxID=1219028 RepID=X0PWF3_RHOWR|nr:cyclase family protein [Rhodococcus wratislaviensis]GAF47618.1 hypothetical protein RW1_043_00530 [Rhodococcus wratislaviensis NBRC 100605]
MSWREVADRIRNWGRWGEEDRLGTLNLITPESVVAAAGLVRTGRTFSLAIPFDASGPQGGRFRSNPERLMSAINGTMSGPKFTSDSDSPFRFSDDSVFMALQAATQWDAIAHVSYDGRLYNGIPADSIDVSGSAELGIHRVAQRGGIVARGVLIDSARHLGIPYLAPDTAVTPAMLDETLETQGVQLREGDVLLVRTGWWQRFIEQGPDRWMAEAPGLSWRCAEWLHDRGVAAVATDTAAVEVRKTEPDAVTMLLHMLTLRDMGMMLGELWRLDELAEECANDQVYEFLLVAAALPFTGAMGTPVAPVAIK